MLVDPAEPLDVIVIATGSEVALAVEAAARVEARGINVRVVSMPSIDVFERQDVAYREAVLPSNLAARVAVEAGVTNFWYKYVGLHGKVVGIDTFGESAPAAVVFEHFGFSVEGVIKAIDEVLGYASEDPVAEVAAK